MDNKIFEKVFERIELCGIDFSLIAKVEIKQILAEIWQDGYDKGLEKGTDMFSVEQIEQKETKGD